MRLIPLRRTWLLCALISATWMSSCAPKSITPEIVKIVIPDVGEENTAELGDTILKRGVVRVYDAVVLNNTLTAGQVTLFPQTLVARSRTPDRVYFYADVPLTVRALLGGTSQVFGGLAISTSAVQNALGVVDAQDDAGKKKDKRRRPGSPVANARPKNSTSSSGGSKDPIKVWWRSTSAMLTPNELPSIEYTSYFEIVGTNLVQELIYNGRSGNTVRLT